ncbi:MAG: MarR family transcriptional regulator [Anaerolineales bacterium]|nr:MarR family transcriptional regulator [Anaerolineales bacterium]
MSLSDQEALQINQALFSLTHAYEARMARENPPDQTGMTLYDCAVLMVIGQFAPIQAREVARRMDVAASTISVYVRRLTDKGMVASRRDPNDRRTWWLHLTEVGQFAYQQIVAGTVRYTRDFFSSLSAPEQQTLHSLLHKVAHELGFTWQ